ncbi:MAG: DolP-mannose mannosyltransferase, partial [Candidatus Erginobacter occultus]|nr:DolP-mannose mannosyltransferase [Candidatus Erginobacter occultus]
LHQPTRREILPVAGNHFYLGRQIYRGDLLYRDIFIDKPPLTEYIIAAAFLAAGGELIPAVIITRLIFFAFYLASALPLYLIARRVLGSRFRSRLAVLVYLGFGFPYDKLAVSADWHVLMVFFGLTAVAVYLAGRPLVSGLCAALSFLSWQPGLTFPIALLAGSLLFPRSGRDSRRLAVGFLIPVAAVIIYTGFRGNLADFFQQTVLYGRINVSSEFFWGLRVVPRVVRKLYWRSLPFILLGTAGYLLNWLRVARSGRREFEKTFFPLVLLSLLILISAANFQGGRDMIPLLPWISLYVLYPAGRLEAKMNPRAFQTLAAAAIVGLAAWSLAGTIRLRPPWMNLERQELQMLKLAERYHLGADDQILCLESVLPCLFLDRTNLTRHTYYLQEKHYRFIETYEPGGFDSVLEAVRGQKPALVFVHLAPWSAPDWPAGRFQPLRNLLAEEGYRSETAGRALIYHRGDGNLDR